MKESFRDSKKHWRKHKRQHTHTPRHTRSAPLSSELMFCCCCCCELRRSSAPALAVLLFIGGTRWSSDHRIYTDLTWRSGGIVCGVATCLLFWDMGAMHLFFFLFGCGLRQRRNGWRCVIGLLMLRRIYVWLDHSCGCGDRDIICGCVRCFGSVSFWRLCRFIAVTWEDAASAVVYLPPSL